MENGMLFVKLTILGYCVLRYIHDNGQNMTAVVWFMLIYIAVSVSLYIVKQDKLKKSLLLIVILLIGSFFTFSSALFMFILFGAANVAQLILNEKKNRMYYRICTAPTHAKTYLAGNVLANMAIIIIQITVILLLITLVFNIQTYVAFYQMFLLLVCFGLVAAGLGFLIVAFSGQKPHSKSQIFCRKDG